MVGKSVSFRFKSISRLLVCLIAAAFFCIFCGFDSSQQKVYDNAGILTDSQEAKLQKKCVEYAEKAKTDIIILTAENTTKKSSMQYTEDFFMAHDFGYDKLHGDGVIMLIDMHNREIWISTSGNAIKYLSDKRIDNIITSVTGKLSDGNYYDACTVFIEKTADYMTYLPSSSDAGGNGSTSTVHDAASLTEKLFYAFPVKLAIAAAVAIVITFILRSQNKAAMAVDNHRYMREHKYIIREQRDRFIRSTRVRHEKASSSSGGGGGHSGGSSHHGSGGHSFGGGGGKF
ncbi:MAG: TPM domain-containing protein [Bacteroides sp.]